MASTAIWTRGSSIHVSSGEDGTFIVERRQALQLVLSVVLATSALLGAVALFFRFVPTFYSLLVVGGISAIGLILNLRGYHRIAGVLLLLGILAGIEVNAYFGEGIHDIALIAIPAVVITAGLLYGPQMVPWYTLLSVLAMAGTALMPNQHQFYVQNLEDMVLGSLLISGTGVLVYFMTRRLEHHIEQVEASRTEVVLAYEATLEGWSKILELRDGSTEGHSQRVTDLTLKLARALGITDRTALQQVRRGALLHDIGKIAIPDSILLKQGPLTEAERETMKRHTVFAGSVIEGIPYSKPAIDIALYHHESWDGSGYPSGLCGEAIPLGARMFAIVDNWDALISDRPYRRGLPKDEVIRYMRANAGTKFDPHIVEVFLQLMENNHV